ncbi:MAG: CPBP family intramembrane glutamic endopeptidase [Thermoguttaceae bacterium]|jgi:membrane protease YdiL (CAAX protease family)
MAEELSPPPNFALLAAMFEGSLSAVAVAAGGLLGRPPMQTLQLNPTALALGAVAVLPMLALLGLCVWVPYRPFSDVMGAADRMVAPLFRSCSLLEMAVIALLAGLGEEMLFRGVLQATLADWARGMLHAPAAAGATADYLALAAVTVLFGLLHAANAGYAFLAGLVGLYLGWLWLATANLTLPITAHALYDFLALVYLVRLRKPRPVTLL